MAKDTCFYRKYIRGVVSQANKANAQYSSNLVYNLLVKWLKEKDIHLEKEMFNAVLSASHTLANNYFSSGTENIKEACANCFYYHSFTAPDNIHTDVKQVQKYVTEFWSVLKERLNSEKSLGNVLLRQRKVDVVCVGKLFDSVLKYVPEEQKDKVIELMDDFVRNDLEK